MSSIVLFILAMMVGAFVMVVFAMLLGPETESEKQNRRQRSRKKEEEEKHREFLAIATSPSPVAMVSLVVMLLNSSDEWEIDASWAEHPIGIELWVGSEQVDLSFNNKDYELSADDRKRLWYAYCQLRDGATAPDTLLLAKRIAERYPLTDNDGQKSIDTL